MAVELVLQMRLKKKASITGRSSAALMWQAVCIGLKPKPRACFKWILMKQQSTQIWHVLKKWSISLCLTDIHTSLPSPVNKLCSSWPDSFRLLFLCHRQDRPLHLRLSRCQVRLCKLNTTSNSFTFHPFLPVTQICQHTLTQHSDYYHT